MGDSGGGTCPGPEPLLPTPHEAPKAEGADPTSFLSSQPGPPAWAALLPRLPHSSPHRSCLARSNPALPSPQVKLIKISVSPPVNRQVWGFGQEWWDPNAGQASKGSHLRAAPPLAAVPSLSGASISTGRKGLPCWSHGAPWMPWGSGISWPLTAPPHPQSWGGALTGAVEHGEHDGGHPSRVAVACPEVAHERAEEDAHGLGEAVGETSDHEAGAQHSPAPAAVRGSRAPPGATSAHRHCLCWRKRRQEGSSEGLELRQGRGMETQRGETEARAYPWEPCAVNEARRGNRGGTSPQFPPAPRKDEGRVTGSFPPES